MLNLLNGRYKELEDNIFIATEHFQLVIWSVESQIITLISVLNKISFKQL